MIDYLSKINYLSIKLITCQNKLITNQKMIDYSGQNYHYIATQVRYTASHYRRPLLQSTE